MENFVGICWMDSIGAEEGYGIHVQKLFVWACHVQEQTLKLHNFPHMWKPLTSKSQFWLWNNSSPLTEFLLPLNLDSPKINIYTVLFRGGSMKFKAAIKEWSSFSEPTKRKSNLYDFYRGLKINSEPIELNEKFKVLLSGLCGVLSGAISRHSKSCVTTSLMSGLFAEFDSVHDKASSTNFPTEQLSMEPSNLGSTMFWMLPSAIRGSAQSTMWMLFPEFLIMAGWPVMSSNNTIPKLYTSLFLVKFPDKWILQQLFLS